VWVGLVLAALLRSCHPNDQKPHSINAHALRAWGCYEPRNTTSCSTGNRVVSLCGDQKDVFRSSSVHAASPDTVWTD
jgi:hypothetical protein